MIDCIFTLDYEIYGDGTGGLKELIYEPAERLRQIFRRWNARFVAFVEAAELEKIQEVGADPAIEAVERQIRELYREEFEIGLHLHPQWSNARLEQGRWVLDFGEYNLCTLASGRIAGIVGRSLSYLRRVLDRASFAPLSFRAGNWLFQPSQPAAGILARHGVRIDSSVFKGGVQHAYGLDYRRAEKNDYYWPFGAAADLPDAEGELIEVPIYTESVPFWRMATGKRLGFRNGAGGNGSSMAGKLNRFRDLARLRYPLKLDFCRMTLRELTSTMERIIEHDEHTPAVYKPVVAIGHTKDLRDPQTVDDFLAFLNARTISVTTFERSYPRLRRGAERLAHVI